MWSVGASLLFSVSDLRKQEAFINEINITCHIATHIVSAELRMICICLLVSWKNNNSDLRLCNLQRARQRYVALFKQKKKKHDTTSANTMLQAAVAVMLLSLEKQKSHLVWTWWCNWRFCCLDASAEFMRGRQEGYQKGKEQHVGENIDLTGGKWAKSCQNKSIWRDSNTD